MSIKMTSIGERLSLSIGNELNHIFSEDTLLGIYGGSVPTVRFFNMTSWDDWPGSTKKDIDTYAFSNL